jgi:hypothetical protein
VLLACGKSGGRGWRFESYCLPSGDPRFVTSEVTEFLLSIIAGRTHRTVDLTVASRSRAEPQGVQFAQPVETLRRQIQGVSVSSPLVIQARLPVDLGQDAGNALLVEQLLP